MALAGLTGGRLSLKADIPQTPKQIRPFSAQKEAGSNIKEIAMRASAESRPLHDVLMTARGWPEIAWDGRLLVTQQDALLMGGKVQAMPGFADHVRFLDAALCAACIEKSCIAMCSGQAITLGEEDAPAFEREKCVHCGACLWNCAHPPKGKTSNIEFSVGAGGLHSAEN
jgi:electron-transferring-flavoprotein dehydrogenase